MVSLAMQLELNGLKALIALAFIAITGIVAVHFTPGDNTPTVSIIVGFTSSVAVGILTLMKVHEARIAAESTANRVRTDLTIEAAKVKDALTSHSEVVRGQLDDIHVTGNMTHALVNNNMGLALRSNAILARRLANQATATEADRAAADLAEKLYIEHEGRQKQADLPNPWPNEG